MVFHLRRRHKHRFSSFTQLTVITLIMSIAFAHIDTIWAIYIKSFVGKDSYVGIISAIFVAFGFFLYFYLIPFLEKHRPSRTYIWSLLIFAVTYVLLALTKSFYLFMILGFILVIGYVLRRESLGVIIRENSKLKDIGKNEGLVYTVINVGWLVGPLIAGFASEKYGINFVFLLASCFIIMAIIMFLLSRFHENTKTPKEFDKNLFKNFKDFFKNKDLVKTYIIGGGIDLWWALIYIFIPLYILKQGLGQSAIGIFLFLVVIPLVLFEYYFSKRVNKIGYKKIFMAGYTILAIMALIAFFLTNAYLVLLMFVVAGIGAALLEPSTESYFFKIVPKTREHKYYSPYCTTTDAFGILGKLVGAGILFILPYKFLFLAFAILMFGFSLFSLKIKRKGFIRGI